MGSVLQTWVLRGGLLSWGLVQGGGVAPDHVVLGMWLDQGPPALYLDVCV